jgi:hypothetical protein
VGEAAAGAMLAGADAAAKAPVETVSAAASSGQAKTVPVECFMVAPAGRLNSLGRAHRADAND